MIWSPKAFLALGIGIAGKLTMSGNLTSEYEFFKSTYGVTPDVCSHTWEYITHYRVKPKRAVPKHLLWCLIFLKTYGTETFLARIFGTTEKTYRKWTWLMVDSINKLYSKVVSTKFLHLY